MTNAYYLNQFISTTLSTVGGIDDSQTTGIKIASTSGVTTDKPGILCLSYSDPIDITKAEWISYTSIDGTNELQGVTRGDEGFSAKAHSNGVTVAFPISRSHINNLNDALIIDGDETNLVEGVISPSGTSTNPSTELVTKSYADGGLVTSLSRQAIINGNFDVWQRGTSFTNPAAATFTADRWGVTLDTDGWTHPTTITHSRQSLTAGGLSGSFFHYRINTNGAGSGTLGNATQYALFYRIEHGTRFLCGNGKKVTFSIYAKSDISNKKMIVSLSQRYGSGGSPTSNEAIKGTITTLTSTLTKYTFTFTTNTLAGKTFGTDNNDYLQIRLDFIWNPTYAATITDDSASNETFLGSGNIDIAQVQLCAGDVALPFMPKSYEEELRACKRYCHAITTVATHEPIAMAVAVTTVAAYAVVPLGVPMRVVPTITATAGDWALLGVATKDLTAIAVDPNYSGTTAVTVTCTDSSAGLTAGQGYILKGDGTAGRVMIFNAEL